jgi:hypothetical protein
LVVAIALSTSGSSTAACPRTIKDQKYGTGNVTCIHDLVFIGIGTHGITGERAERCISRVTSISIEDLKYQC